jgi:hypothetical protein
MNHTQSQANPASFDEDSAHGPRCAQRFIGAAECTCGKADALAERAQRLSRAQTAAAIARVAPCPQGFTYWTKDNRAPVYATRKEAEEVSITEWRINL